MRNYNLTDNEEMYLCNQKVKNVAEVGVNKERIKDRMNRRAERDVKANNKKCQFKWTVKSELLAPRGFSSGHQASHHGDANVTMVMTTVTNQPRDTNAAKNSSVYLVCFRSPFLLSIFSEQVDYSNSQQSLNTPIACVGIHISKLIIYVKPKS